MGQLAALSEFTIHIEAGHALRIHAVGQVVPFIQPHLAVGDQAHQQAAARIPDFQLRFAGGVVEAQGDLVLAAAVAELQNARSSCYRIPAHQGFGADFTLVADGGEGRTEISIGIATAATAVLQHKGPVGGLGGMHRVGCASFEGEAIVSAQLIQHLHRTAHDWRAQIELKSQPAVAAFGSIHRLHARRRLHRHQAAPLPETQLQLGRPGGGDDPLGGAERAVVAVAAGGAQGHRGGHISAQIGEGDALRLGPVAAGEGERLAGEGAAARAQIERHIGQGLAVEVHIECGLLLAVDQLGAHGRQTGAIRRGDHHSWRVSRAVGDRQSGLILGTVNVVELVSEAIIVRFNVGNQLQRNCLIAFADRIGNRRDVDPRFCGTSRQNNYVFCKEIGGAEGCLWCVVVDVACG